MAGRQEFMVFCKGEFSPYYRCNFKVGGTYYRSLLQYILHQKALLLGKTDIAKSILESRDLKEMESKCNNIIMSEADKEKWESSCRNIIKQGSMGKFHQNDTLKMLLLETSGKILVYADVRDQLLGIGLSDKDHSVYDRSKWLGQNILGEVLMEIRDNMPPEDKAVISGQQHWRVGDKCSAQWSEDGRFYEAEIIFVNERDQSCVVKYCKYNNEETRDFSQLKPFHDKPGGQRKRHHSKEDKRHSHESWDDDQYGSHHHGSREEAGGSEKFTFFWQAQSPFSQWYICNFKVDGVQYNCAEQYMMHQKALVFNDEESAKEVMAARRPVHQKQIGRNVKGYDEEKWNSVCKDIVKRGNIAKFTQNKNLWDELSKTAGTTLVEASPVDRKWGIGLAAEDERARRRETWNGSNLLGEVLTEVRDELLQKPPELFPETDEPEVEECPEGYTLFWRNQSPFSQWFSAHFVKDGIHYNCAEQYMMHQKAVYFNDVQSARRILAEKDPRTQKQLAKGVKGFDETEWNKVSKKVVKDGNIAKYSQNADLREELFATANSVLVEASKDDFRWGIGSTKDDPISWHKRTWRGENWLGYILTEVRNELMQETWNGRGRLWPRSHAGISYRAFSLPQSPFHMFYSAEILLDGITFSTAGHCLLYKIAIARENRNLAEQVLQTTDEKQLSSFGEQLLLPFYLQQLKADELWKLLHEINRAKFDAHKDLHQKLLDTGSDYLVYAADDPPLGTDYKHICSNADNWLGQTLMTIREKIHKPTGFYSRTSPYHVRQTIADSENETHKITTHKHMLGDQVSQAIDCSSSNKTQQTAHAVKPEGQRSVTPGKDANKRQPQPEPVVFEDSSNPLHLWYPTKVVFEGISYECAAQCILHQAAVTLKDEKFAEFIVKERDESLYTDFDRPCNSLIVPTDWRDQIQALLLEVNMAKFHQNTHLKNFLLSTGNARMVFAREDRFMGTGCLKDKLDVNNTKGWRGKNYLGKSLVNVRDLLKKEVQEAIQEDKAEFAEAQTTDTVKGNDYCASGSSLTDSGKTGKPTSYDSENAQQTKQTSNMKKRKGKRNQPIQQQNPTSSKDKKIYAQGQATSLNTRSVQAAETTNESVDTQSHISRAEVTSPPSLHGAEPEAGSVGAQPPLETYTTSTTVSSDTIVAQSEPSNVCLDESLVPLHSVESSSLERCDGCSVPSSDQAAESASETIASTETDNSLIDCCSQSQDVVTPDDKCQVLTLSPGTHTCVILSESSENIESSRDNNGEEVVSDIVPEPSENIVSSKDKCDTGDETNILLTESVSDVLPLSAKNMTSSEDKGDVGSEAVGEVKLPTSTCDKNGEEVVSDIISELSVDIVSSNDKSNDETNISLPESVTEVLPQSAENMTSLEDYVDVNSETVGEEKLPTSSCDKNGEEVINNITPEPSLNIVSSNDKFNDEINISLSKSVTDVLPQSAENLTSSEDKVDVKNSEAAGDLKLATSPSHEMPATVDTEQPVSSLEESAKLSQEESKLPIDNVSGGTSDEDRSEASERQSETVAEADSTDKVSDSNKTMPEVLTCPVDENLSENVKEGSRLGTSNDELVLISCTLSNDDGTAQTDSLMTGCHDNKAAASENNVVHISADDQSTHDGSGDVCDSRIDGKSSPDGQADGL